VGWSKRVVVGWGGGKGCLCSRNTFLQSPYGRGSRPEGRMRWN
jgi:hypothetical protein